MKRLFDLIAGALAALVLLLPIVPVALAVRLTSKGPALYWFDRVGRNNTIFKMPKFRSMQIGTPVVATHLLRKPDAYLTPIGSFLSKSSLDELPQLWSILVGDMSFVGPRPALFNQHDLIELRTRQGVHALVPGLTGWAQVNGRDELPKAEREPELARTLNALAPGVLAQEAAKLGVWLIHYSIKLKACEVMPVLTNAFPTPAKRPHNSRLNTTKLQTTFGLTLPPWQQGVDRMLAETF